MAEFKCIGCGAIKESNKPCSCSVCGHRMFEMPYERGTLLLSEIKRFIEQLEAVKIERKNLIFTDKAKDDNRFPGYDKILHYVTDPDRTEDFLNNLLETVKHLKLHFAESFSNTYPVSFEKIDEMHASFDPVLSTVAEKLKPGTEVKWDAISWPKVTLLYSETPNQYLRSSADELLDSIEKLARKITAFIRANNLYGQIHQYHPDRRKKKDQEKIDYKDVLEKEISDTVSILSKRYILDIEDDGAEELREMLTCLWYGIESIMNAPLLIKNYDYLWENEGITEEEFFRRVSEKISERYRIYNELIDPDALFAGSSEDDLFQAYMKLALLDNFGFLVPKGSSLINIGESERKLEKLVGLTGIKESVKKLKAYALANKDTDSLNIHMCFLGNPGSGKTEVARYIAGILYENKILPSNKMIEVDRSGLVSEYFGATAEKTSRVISRAMGGVLFIDEAYALGNNSDDGGITDYGKEAIDTLVKAMEDHRGKFCVILAGYKNEMLKMLSTNPGFRSRIQFVLDFPNYSRDELKSISGLMLKDRKYTIGEEAINRILDITDVKRKEPNFANARELRNILDQVIMCQNLRSMGSDDKELGIVDVNKYIHDAKINLPTAAGQSANKILTGEEELDQLIGLSSIKRMVRKIKAYAKRNAGEEGFNLHMCFYGNPGTGKTEVARILSRILYDAGVLDEAKLVETDGHGLLGRVVGETAPKTKAKIDEAMNGVLFIDEAYSLGSTAASGESTTYGDEAVAVLLKEMEDRRGHFCVILAGYKNEMQELIRLNPGFESRIQFTLDFPDYTREELGEIAKRFLSKKKYEIEDNALERLLDVVEYYRARPNFANARTVRNILDQVIMNQNLRTEDYPDENTVIIDDIEDYLADEGIDLKVTPKSRTIGFA